MQKTLSVFFVPCKRKPDKTLVRLETTMLHMAMKALDRISVVRFNRSYMVPALKEAGRMLAEHYSDFRFDGVDASS